MVTGAKIVVRYAETDKMGIVHHSVYPIWYEVARTEFIKTMGLTYSEFEEMGVMTPLVELTSKYRLPAQYEDELEVKIKVQRLSPARITFYYEIYCKDKLINTGTTEHAWVGANLKPINMKKAYPHLYEAMEKTMQE